MWTIILGACLAPGPHGGPFILAKARVGGSDHHQPTEVAQMASPEEPMLQEKQSAVEKARVPQIH